jgi:uncharacterized membrane protein YgcG
MVCSEGGLTVSGSGLTPRQQDRIQAFLDRCHRDNDLDLSVVVGDLTLSDLAMFRRAAEQLHASLGARSASAVLVVVAPGQRRVDIVTGPSVRRRVPDRVCALAVLSMTTAFAGGDLVGGILDGLRQLSSAAGGRLGLPVGASTGELVRQH